MATNETKNKIGYDPLAWLAQEIETEAEEALNSPEEAASEPVSGHESEMNADVGGLDSLAEAETGSELIEETSSEIDMNIIADLAEEPITDEAEEEVAEPLLNLDAILTIQSVGKLHERLKKSYSANDAIEINAAQVSSIDTSTLQLLVALKKDAVKRQKQVFITKPSRRFIESAELLGLLELFEVEA